MSNLLIVRKTQRNVKPKGEFTGISHRVQGQGHNCSTDESEPEVLWETPKLSLIFAPPDHTVELGH